MLADDVQQLLDELNYPPGDIRAEAGRLALEIARGIDAGELSDGTECQGPRGYLREIIDLVAGFPNDPPTFADGLLWGHTKRAWKRRIEAQQREAGAS